MWIIERNSNFNDPHFVYGRSIINPILKKALSLGMLFNESGEFTPTLPA